MEPDFDKLRRYEIKYRITEKKAAEIRKWLQPIFSLDKHADPEVDGYVVNNLYFDTLDLRFYHDTKFRKLRRYKPRARYYGNHPDDFLMLEIKNKENNIIWKKRKRVSISEWMNFRDHGTAEHTGTFSPLPNSFEELMCLTGAQPVMHVRYFREPWVSDIDDYGRVTFDRSLSYKLAHGSWDIEAKNEEMIFYDDPITTSHDNSPVILEIKTESLVPIWAIELIRNFNLGQKGFSKYCYVIDRCNEFHEFSRHSAY